MADPPPTTLLPLPPCPPVSHPCVIQYFGSYIAEGQLNIVMEWASGGDLAAVIKGAVDGGRCALSVSLPSPRVRDEAAQKPLQGSRCWLPWARCRARGGQGVCRLSLKLRH
jgi:hypothetical protein